MSDLNAYEVRQHIKDCIDTDKYLLVSHRFRDNLTDTRAFISMSRRSHKQTFHTDRDCPHFPQSALFVTTISFARKAVYYNPCDYCTKQ